MARYLATMLIVLLMVAPLWASTFRVPIDAPDLPTALLAAQDGDTVAVAASLPVPGGVVIPGRDIAVLGGWDDAFSAVVGRTVISGSSSAPAMRLDSPVSGSPSVAGFDIVGGGGAERLAPIAGRYGGGVLVEGGAPILRDLSVVAAEAGDLEEFGAGGGMAFLDTEATLENVVVQDCRAVWGGGIYINRGAVSIRNAVVSDNDNRTSSGGEEARGAGIAVHLGELVIEDSEIRGGRGAVRGGGLAWTGTRGFALEILDCVVSDNEMDLDGAGLYAENGTVTIAGGRFEGNGPSPGAPYTSGGGAYLTGARATIEGVVFQSNSADAGGGVTVNTAPVADVSGCTFLDNEVSLFGAAVNYQSNDEGVISANTVAANTGASDRGVVNVVNASPLFERNLIALNDGGGVALAAGTLAPSCNDVYGNTGAAWSGLPDPTGAEGNISADPLFCDLADGDVTLDAASPCLDIPGCGIAGAWGEGCGGEIGVTDAPSTILAVSAHPNPFNPSTTIRFELPGSRLVNLQVFDAAGRLVRVLVNDEHLGVGRHGVAWDGRDDGGRRVPSGVYLYRIQAGSAGDVGRMVLVK